MELSDKLQVPFGLPQDKASPPYVLSKADLRTCLYVLEKTEISFSFVSNYDFQLVANSPYRLRYPGVAKENKVK